MTELVYTSILTATSCGVCGIPFAIPDNHLSKLKATGDTFYCPSGHGISYSEGTNARLKRELAAANGNARYYEGRLSTEERRSAAFKGQVTKIKKRVAAGVCPCCNRTFQDLGRHMAGQHPDFAGAGTVSL